MSSFDEQDKKILILCRVTGLNLCKTQIISISVLWFGGHGLQLGNY